MSRSRNIVRSTKELIRKPVATLALIMTLGGLSLAACESQDKDKWMGKIPLCGIPLVAIEQPKEVPPFTVTENRDGSFGPKISEAVLAKIKAATVKIKYMRKMKIGSDQVVRTGTGVIVNGRINTAAHTISGLDPSSIVIERADNGARIPVDPDPTKHCAEYIVDGVRKLPEDQHGNSTLDAALLTPAVTIEPGLTYAIATRGWGIHGGFADRNTAEFAVGLQVITGSDGEFPNGQMLTGLNGAPSERGDSGGPTTNMAGECTGIIVSATDGHDAAYLKNHVGVTTGPGSYQLTRTVLSQDLQAMERVLNGPKTSLIPS